MMPIKNTVDKVVRIIADFDNIFHKFCCDKCLYYV